MTCQRRIRVCHVVDGLGVGGMENGVVNLSNSFDRSRFKPSILCLKSEAPLAGRLCKDVEVFFAGYKSGFEPWVALRVSRILRKERIHIAHTHAWGGGSLYGIIGARLAGVPVVINGEHGSFFLRPHQVIAQKLLFLACDANLAVSEALKGCVVDKLGVIPEGIQVIRNGVDTKRFSGCYERGKVLQRLRDEGYPVEDRDRYVLSVGSLKPEKDQVTLLNAYKQLKANLSSNMPKLLLVGDGPDASFLSSLVISEGLQREVFLLGNRDDIPELMSIGSVLICTSIAKHEGLSNVILEAMSSGVPVISTSSVGTEELVQNGVNGFIVREADIEAIAGKLSYLLDNDGVRSVMSSAAKGFVQETFSLDKMVKNYESLYTKTLYSKLLK